MSKSRQKKTKKASTPSSLDNSSLSTGDSSQLYEPVLDLSVESPLRVQGNLTGTPRRLKDLTADWYNGKLRWKRNCQKGFVVCNKIGDIKMDCFGTSELLPETLLPLCDELKSVIDTLQASADKMNRWTESTQSLKDLLVTQNKAADVIFQTWTIDHFVRASEELLSMYRSELKLKRNIYENICHSRDKKELTFMLSCWAHDPYLDDWILMKIDAMVAETGHET